MEGAPSFMADRKTNQPVQNLKVYDNQRHALGLKAITMIPGPSAPKSLRRRFKSINVGTDSNE